MSGDVDALQNAYRKRVGQRLMASIRDEQGHREVLARGGEYIVLECCNDQQALQAIRRRIQSQMNGLEVSSMKVGGCLPGNLLENIFQVIDSRKHLARGYSYEDNRDTILDNIRQSQLPVTGQLGTVFLDLNDIYHLKVGDVIDMNKGKDKDVKLYVGTQPWFTGKMGVYKKNVAIRISRRLYEEEMAEEGVQDSLPET